MSTPHDTWFADWFDEDYLAIYAHRDDADAADAVDLLRDLVAPKPGVRVLDLACGSGRHLSRMQALGLVATGLDLSASLLARGRRVADRLVRADMRALPFRDRAFALVTSFFTSFGYFDDPDNQRVVAEVARVLAPRGQLLLDLPNRDPTIRDLTPESRRAVGDRDVIERRHYDHSTARVIKDITITTPRGQRSVRESVRLYTATELTAMLQQAGFNLHQLRGGFAGAPYDEATSKRMIACARKP